MTSLKDNIIKALEEIKLSDLNELIKEIEKRFNIRTTIGTKTIEQTKIEDSLIDEKSLEVNVVLTDTGPSKVAIIKLVKEITGKELMASKTIVDKLPAIIKEKINIEEAEEIKNRLIEVGASVEFK